MEMDGSTKGCSDQCSEHCEHEEGTRTSFLVLFFFSFFSSIFYLLCSFPVLSFFCSSVLCCLQLGGILLNPWPIKIKRHGWGPEFEAGLKQLNSLMFELPDDETWLRWQKASSYASNFAHEKAKAASLAQFGTTSFAPSPGKCLRYCLPILFRLIPPPLSTSPPQEREELA